MLISHSVKRTKRKKPFNIIQRSTNAPYTIIVRPYADLNDPRRNDPCTCGSGLRSKHCCFRISSPHPLNSPEFQERLQLELQRHQAKEHQRKKLQGLGRPIVSCEHNGFRFVAIKNQIAYSKEWKTFIDFLFAYIRNVLGADWLQAEREKPNNQRHPIIEWFELVRDFSAEHAAKSEGELFTAMPNGAFKALISLAYDLYLCAHNWELPESLIKRLKNRQNFEGALYETYVIGCFAKSGYEIEFEDEAKGYRTYCEFIASHKETGRRFSVEAKAIQGEVGQNQAGGPKIHRKLSKALRKDAAHERIVFIELSQPEETDMNEIPGWADQVLQDIERAEIDDKSDLPPAFVFFTNRPFIHDLNLPRAREAMAAAGFKVPHFPYGRNGAFLKEAIEARDREWEIYALLKAIETQSDIPNTFDESFIEEAELPKDTPRLLIGETYLVPNEDGTEVPGVLRSAIVQESEMQVIGSYQLQNGKGIIVTCPISEPELRLYRRSPETFFGVKEHPQGKIETPLDAYDFVYETYSKSTKENLLKFLESAKDIERLKTMPQEELAKEYSLRIATSIWRDKTRRG